MRLSTNKMRRAVMYCENWCNDAHFIGNIDDFYEVHAFLNRYLVKAQENASKAIHGSCEITYGAMCYSIVSHDKNITNIEEIRL